MKTKITLLLLFISSILFAQNFTPYTNVQVQRLKVVAATKKNDATRVMVQDSITKEVFWVLKTSLIPPVPNLQQVLNAGNSAFQTITLDEGVIGANAHMEIGKLSVSRENDLAKVEAVNGISFENTAITPLGVKVSTNTGGAYTGTIKSDNITADRNYQLPDASGTLALTDDISSLDLDTVLANGNVSDEDIIISDLSAYATISPGGFTATAESSDNCAVKTSGIEIATGGSGNKSTIKADLLTANRTHQLPNASGTLALESYVNITADRTFYINSVTGNNTTGKQGDVNLPFQTTAAVFAAMDSNKNVKYTLVYMDNALHTMPILPIRDIDFVSPVESAYLDFTSTVQDGSGNLLDTPTGFTLRCTYKFRNLRLYSNSATSKRFYNFYTNIEFDRCYVDWLTNSSPLFEVASVSGNFKEIKTRSTNSSFFRGLYEGKRTLFDIESVNIVSNSNYIFQDAGGVNVHVKNIIGSGNLMIFLGGGGDVELNLYNINMTSGVLYLSDQNYNSKDTFIFHNTIISATSTVSITGASGIYTGRLHPSNTRGLSATFERGEIAKFKSFTGRLENFNKYLGSSVFEFENCNLTCSTFLINLRAATAQVNNNIRFFGTNTIKQDTPSSLIDNIADFTGTIQNYGTIYTNATALDNDGTITISGTLPIISPMVLPSNTSIGNVSSTEISYLDGVSSAIQTQIDGKKALPVARAATLVSLAANTARTPSATNDVEVIIIFSQSSADGVTSSASLQMDTSGNGTFVTMGTAQQNANVTGIGVGITFTSYNTLTKIIPKGSQYKWITTGTPATVISIYETQL